MLLAPEVAIWAILPDTYNCCRFFYLSKKDWHWKYANVRRVADLNSTLNNNLQGITTIKSFTAEDRK